MAERRGEPVNPVKINQGGAQNQGGPGQQGGEQRFGREAERERARVNADPGGHGLRGQDKQQAHLQNPTVDNPQSHQEGVERPRTGPLDRNAGRNEKPEQVPQAPAPIGGGRKG